MENNSLALEKKLLDLIYRNITSRLNQIDNNGLSEGKIGIVLFLYYYAQIIDSDKIREEADTILDDVWVSINSIERSYLFFSGHSGIVWSLFWLGRKGFLDIDDTLDPYTGKVDFYLFREQKSIIPVLIDPESNLFIHGFYITSRCNQPKINLFKDCYWQETAIYLIEDCDRILHRKTSSNNAFLPELTLSLLNSILYFLIEVHKLRLYPHKTSSLIEYSCSLIKELMTVSSIQDLVTTEKMLSIIDNNSTLIKEIHSYMLTEDMSPSMCTIDDTSIILSESGLNSLLYNNKMIFRDVYSSISRSNSTYLNKIYNRIENEELSIKTLLGIGYGLLTMLEKK